MVERRTEDSPVAPPRTLGGSDSSVDHPTMATEAVTEKPSQRDITERVNAAYASAPPVIPDDVDAPVSADRPTGSERFAAALAAARGTTGPKPAKTPTSTPPATNGPKKVRKARLRLTHIDPWSVMKTSFLLSIAIGIVTVVAVGVVWTVIGVSGVWDSIDSTVGDVVGSQTGDSFQIQDYVGTSRVMGFTMIVAVIDVVLITVISTLGAFLYNLAAVLLGGLELTFAEDDRPAPTKS